jgi:hypothetical protein
MLHCTTAPEARHAVWFDAVADLAALDLTDQDGVFFNPPTEEAQRPLGELIERRTRRAP